MSSRSTCVSYNCWRLTFTTKRQSPSLVKPSVGVPLLLAASRSLKSFSFSAISAAMSLSVWTWLILASVLICFTRSAAQEQHSNTHTTSFCLTRRILCSYSRFKRVLQNTNPWGQLGQTGCPSCHPTNSVNPTKKFKALMLTDRPHPVLVHQVRNGRHVLYACCPLQVLTMLTCQIYHKAVVT